MPFPGLQITANANPKIRYRVIASFPGLFETLEDGPGNEAGYRITKLHVSVMKAVSTQ